MPRNSTALCVSLILTSSSSGRKPLVHVQAFMQAVREEALLPDGPSVCCGGRDLGPGGWRAVVTSLRTVD